MNEQELKTLREWAFDRLSPKREKQVVALLTEIERLTTENARLRESVAEFMREIGRLAEDDSWGWAMNEMYDEVNDRFGKALDRLCESAAPARSGGLRRSEDDERPRTTTRD